MRTIVKKGMSKASVMLAIFVLCTIALTACGGGSNVQGLSQSDGGDQQQTQQSTATDNAPAQSAGSVEVKASVDDYSWAELKVIASEIAAAGDEAAAVEVAKQYNLVGPNGQLDGTQIKMVGWQGSQVPVQIIGFAHDDKSDGTGKAGITFQFVDCIGEMAMNTTGTNDGGWEACEVRRYLNSKFISYLPEELITAIVEVDKSTNNAGMAQDVNAATTTRDVIWLPSSKEVCGDVNWFAADNSIYDEILNAEGEEYKLFRDLNVYNGSNNDILVKNNQGVPDDWILRSSNPSDSAYVRLVSVGGYPNNDDKADHPAGIAPCFCI